MSKTLSAPSATGSRFGWPQPKRVEEFRKLLAYENKGTTRIVFQGQNTDIRIIRVPSELPKYRMTNGRTASLQAEYTAKNPKSRPDLFSGDPELWDAQEVQHGLLLQVANQSDLKKYFEDTTNKQVEPILLDQNGFVVNGNRRLACWRELLQQEPTKYGHFSHVDVSILPHCSEKDIDRLEASLQIEKDIKADYSWDARANMILAKMKRDDFSIKDIADLYKMKESEVREILDMRTYADEYLRSRNKANLWSQVSEHEFAFRKLVSVRNRLSGVGNQEVFKEAAFTLLEKPDEVGRRLYEAIPDIVESFGQVKEKLIAEFNVNSLSKTGDIGDLFGGADTKGIGVEVPLAEILKKPENADKARKIIVEVIESQRQLKKDYKTAGYLLECCTKAQAFLEAAVKSGLRAESKREGVSKQLDEIQAKVAKIRKYLESHAKY